MLGPSSEGGEMIHDPTHPKTREELEDALARLVTPRVGELFGAAGLASFLKF